MIALVLMCLQALGGIGSIRREDPPLKYPVAVKITSLRHEYGAVVRSVRDVDFRNLRYSLAGQSFVLRNGSMHKDRRIGGTAAMDHFDVSVGQIWYFEHQDSRSLYALVSIHIVATAASSSDTGYVLLFETANRHPVITQEFEYDAQAPGASDAFDEERKVLTINARAEDGFPHCCPQHLETDEFRWQGQQFRLMRREILSLARSNPH